MLFPFDLSHLRVLCIHAEMQLSDFAMAVHDELVRVWGVRPKVFRHADPGEENFIMVASFSDAMLVGSTGVATVGLSDHDLGMGPVRLELIGAFPEPIEEAPNIAATCAFNAFKEGFPTRPDAVHRGVVSLYVPDTTVPHIMMANPYLWPDGPHTLDMGELKIAWLMMVPISESELQFADTYGFAELNLLMEAEEVEVLDLHRAVVA